MLLDPRFKQQRLKDNVDAKEFQKILEDKRKILKESILAKLTSDSFITNIISNVNNMGGQPSNILHLQSKSKSSQQILHLQNKSKKQPTNLESQLDTELDRWFSQYSITYDDDVLSYWRTHKDEYPLLSRYVLYIFDIPCSSVAVERLFSIGRNVYGIRRSLKAKSAEAVIFLTYNVKN